MILLTGLSRCARFARQFAYESTTNREQTTCTCKYMKKQYTHAPERVILDLRMSQKSAYPYHSRCALPMENNYSRENEIPQNERFSCHDRHLSFRFVFMHSIASCRNDASRPAHRQCNYKKAKNFISATRANIVSFTQPQWHFCEYLVKDIQTQTYIIG